MNPDQRAAALRLADRLLHSLTNDMVCAVDAAALLRELAQEPQTEPVAWFLGESGNYREVAHWAKGAFPVYAHPQQRQPLTEFRRMQIIGDEFPLALVQPVVIAKVDAVCLAVERAHGIGKAD